MAFDYFQVWPVLCAGGSAPKADGVTPSVTLSLHLSPSLTPQPPSASCPGSGRSASSRPGSAVSGGGPDATAVASVQLQPSTVWLSLPLLQRLQGFIEPLGSMPAASAQQLRSDILDVVLICSEQLSVKCASLCCCIVHVQDAASSKTEFTLQHLAVLPSIVHHLHLQPSSSSYKPQTAYTVHVVGNTHTHDLCTSLFAAAGSMIQPSRLQHLATALTAFLKTSRQAP